jgi:allophanate hydrolase
MTQTFDLRLDTLAKRYRSGEITPRALIMQLRERAMALNPEFHLFIHILNEAELEPYLAALEQHQPEDLPLYGIPFAIKDNIDLAGVPTTAACPAFAYMAGQDATLVRQLIALGRFRWVKPTSISLPPD